MYTTRQREVVIHVACYHPHYICFLVRQFIGIFIPTSLSHSTKPHYQAFQEGAKRKAWDYFMRMREIFCLNIVYSTASSVDIIECAEMEYVDRHLFTTQAACA